MNWKLCSNRYKLSFRSCTSEPDRSSWILTLLYLKVPGRHNHLNSVGSRVLCFYRNICKKCMDQLWDPRTLPNVHIRGNHESPSRVIFILIWFCKKNIIIIKAHICKAQPFEYLFEPFFYCLTNYLKCWLVMRTICNKYIDKRSHVSVKMGLKCFNLG